MRSSFLKRSGPFHLANLDLVRPPLLAVSIVDLYPAFLIAAIVLGLGCSASLWLPTTTQQTAILISNGAPLNSIYFSFRPPPALLPSLFLSSFPPIDRC